MICQGVQKTQGDLLLAFSALFFVWSLGFTSSVGVKSVLTLAPLVFPASEIAGEAEKVAWLEKTAQGTEPEAIQPGFAVAPAPSAVAPKTGTNGQSLPAVKNENGTTKTNPPPVAPAVAAPAQPKRTAAENYLAKPVINERRVGDCAEQPALVEGYVTDKNDQPLSGVNVLVTWAMNPGTPDEKVEASRILTSDSSGYWNVHAKFAVRTYRLLQGFTAQIVNGGKTLSPVAKFTTATCTATGRVRFDFVRQ